MRFFSVTWGLLVVGFVTFIVALVISTRGPSRLQMLLLWLGLGLIFASLAALIAGT
jgi:hypothetical protein